LAVATDLIVFADSVTMVLTRPKRTHTTINIAGLHLHVVNMFKYYGGFHNMY
ncbi:hypothetical protein ACJX0J_005424, partial [Zea mays]